VRESGEEPERTEAVPARGSARFYALRVVITWDPRITWVPPGDLCRASQLSGTAELEDVISEKAGIIKRERGRTKETLSLSLSVCLPISEVRPRTV